MCIWMLPCPVRYFTAGGGNFTESCTCGGRDVMSTHDIFVRSFLVGGRAHDNVKYFFIILYKK